MVSLPVAKTSTRLKQTKRFVDLRSKFQVMYRRCSDLLICCVRDAVPCRSAVSLSAVRPPKVVYSAFLVDEVVLIEYYITATGAAPKRYINYLSDQNTMACRLDSRIHQKYVELPTPGKIMATYVWIDGTGQVSAASLALHACALCKSMPRMRIKQF